VYPQERGFLIVTGADLLTFYSQEIHRIPSKKLFF